MKSPKEQFELLGLKPCCLRNVNYARKIQEKITQKQTAEKIREWIVSRCQFDRPEIVWVWNKNDIKEFDKEFGEQSK